MKIASSVRLSIELAWNGEEVIFDGVANNPSGTPQAPCLGLNECLGLLAPTDQT